MNVFDQVLIDRTMIELDGTKNKAKLGLMQSLVFPWQLRRLQMLLSYLYTSILAEQTQRFYQFNDEHKQGKAC